MADPAPPRFRLRMDPWGSDQLTPWLEHRLELPVGALLGSITGPTVGRPWSDAAARNCLRQLAAHAGVRHRFAPHQLRHAHAAEMAREAYRSTSSSTSWATRTSGITSV